MHNHDFELEASYVAALVKNIEDNYRSLIASRDSYGIEFSLSFVETQKVLSTKLKEKAVHEAISNATPVLVDGQPMYYAEQLLAQPYLIAEGPKNPWWKFWP